MIQIVKLNINIPRTLKLRASDDTTACDWSGDVSSREKIKAAARCTWSGNADLIHNREAIDLKALHLEALSLADTKGCTATDAEELRTAGVINRHRSATDQNVEVTIWLTANENRAANFENITDA